MLELDTVLLSDVAAFCAAESIDEKKPPPPGVRGPFSGVGVRGASVKFESLLGPILVPEPDLIRRCVDNPAYGTLLEV